MSDVPIPQRDQPGDMDDADTANGENPDGRAEPRPSGGRHPEDERPSGPPS